MEQLLAFYSRGLSGKILAVIAISLAGMALARALGNRTALGSNAFANAGVSLGMWLINLLVAPIFALLTAGISQWVAAIGWPHLPPGVLDRLPFWAQVALFMILYDLTDYWVHRLLHTGPGWPVHAIHHSDTDVNGFTTARVHALEPWFARILMLFTLGWAGFPADVVATGLMIGVLHNCYVHMDLDWDHGPFNWLIASPRFHRLHHLDVEAVHHRNLANILPIWDIMFGTWAGTARMRGAYGAAMAGVPATDLVQLWLWPFREWAKALASRARKLA